jgi:hypothetical protein
MHFHFFLVEAPSDPAAKSSLVPLLNETHVFTIGQLLIRSLILY